MQNLCAPREPEEVRPGAWSSPGTDRARRSWQWGPGKPEGKVRTGMLVEKPRSEPCKSQPPDRSDLKKKKKNLGEWQEGMEFVFFSRGSTGPLVSQATGDVPDSHFLNQNKNHRYSSSRYAFSCPLSHEKDKDYVSRLEHYHLIPLPKGVAGGEPETGVWAEGMNARATAHPRQCHLQRTPLPRGPQAQPARAINWEVDVAWKQQLGTGVIS